MRLRSAEQPFCCPNGAVFPGTAGQPKEQRKQCRGKQDVRSNTENTVCQAESREAQKQHRKIHRARTRVTFASRRILRVKLKISEKYRTKRYPRTAASGTSRKTSTVLMEESITLYFMEYRC